LQQMAGLPEVAFTPHARGSNAIVTTFEVPEKLRTETSVTEKVTPVTFTENIHPTRARQQLFAGSEIGLGKAHPPTREAATLECQNDTQANTPSPHTRGSNQLTGTIFRSDNLPKRDKSVQIGSTKPSTTAILHEKSNTRCIMNQQKILTELVALQDCYEIVTDGITRLELLRKLANMKSELVERDMFLKITSLTLRLESLEKQNVTS
jgi:hypothetical protein